MKKIIYVLLIIVLLIAIFGVAPMFIGHWVAAFEGKKETDAFAVWFYGFSEILIAIFAGTWLMILIDFIFNS